MEAHPPQSRRQIDLGKAVRRVTFAANEICNHPQAHLMSKSFQSTLLTNFPVFRAAGETPASRRRCLRLLFFPPMKKPKFVPSLSAHRRCVILSCLSALALAHTVHADDRPNIVLIMADDLGYECVGANGSTMYETPATDDWDPAARRGDATEERRPGDRTSLPHFIDMVAYTDKIVGKLLRQLADAGVRENTLVIFTGDNGVHDGLTSTFEGRPYRGGKGKSTLSATHVPLIVDWPAQVEAGSVCDDLVDFTDMLPTMLDAAGVAMPEEFKPDGRSFLPQLRGEAGEPREWIYCWFPKSSKETIEFAMTHRYKLYKDDRIYDLENDFEERATIKPGERTDEQQRVAQTLMEVIKQHTRQDTSGER